MRWLVPNTSDGNGRPELTGEVPTACKSQGTDLDAGRNVELQPATHADRQQSAFPYIWRAPASAGRTSRHRSKEPLIVCHPRAGGDPEVLGCPGFALGRPSKPLAAHAARFSRERQWRADQRLPKARHSVRAATPEMDRSLAVVTWRCRNYTVSRAADRTRSRGARVQAST